MEDNGVCCGRGRCPVFPRFLSCSLIVLLDTVEVVHAQRLAPVDGAAVDGGGVREAIGGVHGDGGHEPCERRETLGGEDIKDEQDGEEREGHTAGYQ